MEIYIVDTHPLLWYVADDPRIGVNAKAILERAEAGEIQIIVPAIVLVEAIDILNKRRLQYDPTELLVQLRARPQFVIHDLNYQLIEFFKDCPQFLINESHDRLIVVTAQLYGNVPILTKDEKIQQNYSSTVW